MYWREVLLVAVACSLAHAHSTKGEVDSLEESIEQLVRYVHENAHQSHLENEELRTRLHSTRGITSSRRMIQKMKWSTPEIRAKETASIKSLHATKQLMDLTGLSLRDLQNSEEITSAWKKQTTSACPTDQINCSTASNTFRSATGSCNNLANPGHGAAGTAQTRFLPPVYGDGVGSPRTLDRNGQPLPSPRVVSNSVFRSPQQKRENDMSLMVMAWGQFLDHDITLTPSSAGGEGTVTDCCSTTSTQPVECFPIAIPPNDPHFNTSCMDFVRSAAVTDVCSPSLREQFNAITAFVDGSNVYGSSLDQMNGLRSFKNGLLTASTVSSSLPPAGDPHTCVLNSTDDFCIKVGDVRANVVPHLGANHVLFFREHNRIATILSAMNTGWNDERTFQETRKIMAGILQQISYYEWLPSFLSPFYLTKYSLTRSNSDPYKPTTNPSIRNGFAVAAMRFGHSLIPPTEGYLLHDYATWEAKKPIQETFFRPSMVIGNAGQDVPKLARWVCHNSSMRVDRRFEAGVRDLLFLDSDGSSFDLAALNIQRGRDHGIPSYTAFRNRLNLQPLNNFNSMHDHNDNVRDLLKDVYRHVDDIDLFAGGMSEKKVSGGRLGPTFSKMIGKQFKRLKVGDRFWFERPKPEGFSQEQRKEIRKMRLSKVMCTNFGMDQIPRDVFHIQSTTNPLTSCANLPGMDLTLWKE